MYEAILAEKIDNIQREISLLSSAIDAVQGGDNDTVRGFLDSHLKRYLTMYHRLCGCSPTERIDQKE